MKVQVVGAGFSGLTLAYYLTELGADVEIIEKNSETGGLLGTDVLESGLVEHAANALLADADVEELFTKLNLPFAERNIDRKRRYIYWQKPRRWPLTASTTLKLMRLFVRTAIGGKSDVVPIPGETVKAWAKRVINEEFEQRMLTPALQGVYAGRPEELSATLTLLPMILGSSSKGKQRGSVAPVKGMGQLIQALTEYLKGKGVTFHFQSQFELKDAPTTPVAICTSAWSAAKIIERVQPTTAWQLAKCQSLPLVSVTCFFEPNPAELKGFGILFPSQERFHALGALFNTSIFEGRSHQRSETWIFGGALHPDINNVTDDGLMRSLLEDRQRLTGINQRPIRYSIYRWPKAIPYFTTEWEKTLSELETKPPVYLHGNYLGSIGLAKILQRSKKLAQEIAGCR